MIHFSGRWVWETTDSMSLGRLDSSFRAGVMRTYFVIAVGIKIVFLDGSSDVSITPCKVLRTVRLYLNREVFRQMIDRVTMKFELEREAPLHRERNIISG